MEASQLDRMIVRLENLYGHLVITGSLWLNGLGQSPFHLGGEI